MPGSVHDFSYGDVLREHRRSRADRPALIDGDVRLTYRQLDERVNRIRSALAGLEVMSSGAGGGLILWMGQNSHRLVETILAAAKAGYSVLPVNWRSSPAEVAEVIVRTRPAVVMWQREQMAPWSTEIRALTSGHRAEWIAHDAPNGDAGYEQLLAGGTDSDDEGAVDPDRPLLVLMTAAFEGRPLPAQLTHQALLLQGLHIGHVQAMAEETRTLVVGPMFHIASLLTLNATYCWGGCGILAPDSAASTVATTIESERCTHGFIPGPILQDILDAGLSDRHDLSSMFPTTDAIDPKSPIVAEPSSLWQRRPGLAYGQTETTGVVILSSLSAAHDSGRGKPPPLVGARIIRPDGTEAAVDEVGEILIRGPLVMAGYLGDDGATASRITEGWHHTNDLGRRGPEGSIAFVGPKSPLIKSGSENIYPAEVEHCLMEHPAVAEACVIGVPDPRWTQNVKAVVVARPDAAQDDLTLDTLVAFCRERIAGYKKPKELEVVDALPKTGGIVDRAAVNRLYGGGGYPGAG